MALPLLAQTHQTGRARQCMHAFRSGVLSTLAAADLTLADQIARGDARHMSFGARESKFGFQAKINGILATQTALFGCGV